MARFLSEQMLKEWQNAEQMRYSHPLHNLRNTLRRETEQTG